MRVKSKEIIYSIYINTLTIQNCFRLFLLIVCIISWSLPFYLNIFGWFQNECIQGSTWCIHFIIIYSTMHGFYYLVCIILKISSNYKIVVYIIKMILSLEQYLQVVVIKKILQFVFFFSIVYSKLTCLYMKISLWIKPK